MLFTELEFSSLAQTPWKTATLVRFTDAGAPVVQFDDGNGECLQIARTLVQWVEAPLLGSPLIIMLDSSQPDRPIVVGLVHESAIAPLNATNERSLDGQGGLGSLHVEVDGKTLTLEARNHIVLKCGKSSIRMDKSGKIAINGVDVLSSAQRKNRIKGGTVNIN